MRAAAMAQAWAAGLLVALCVGSVVHVVASAAAPAAPLVDSERQYTVFIRHQPDRVATLLDALDRTSDPRSPDYGAFLTHEEVLHLQSPSAADATAVRDALSRAADAHGITFTPATPAWDKVSVVVNAGTDPSVVFADPAFHQQCDMIVPTRVPASELPPWVRRSGSQPRQPLHTAKASASAVPAAELGPNHGVQACLANKADPPCLRTAYGLNGTHGKSPKNRQCVAVNEYYSPRDLASFQKMYKLPAQTLTDIGVDLPTQPGIEGSTDVEYITTTGNMVPTYWVYLNATDPNPFTTWLTWSANVSDAELPLVHSLSVGVPENAFETLGASAIPRMNNEMAALGVRGASIFFASGDSGYPGQYQSYPASSPYVTAVGGVWNGDLGMSPLSVDPISSGGFSGLDVNPILDYQVAAVAHWNATDGKRPRAYNMSHRCVPDISAFDTSYQVFVAGGIQPVGGTSCAAPVAAGVFSMVNDALLLEGFPPLGFLNPFLYANTDCFYDITVGNNRGFQATQGYDPASGIGTFAPDTFAKLTKAALEAKSAARARLAQAY